jgi:flagellar hook-length control protein FliK
MMAAITVSLPTLQIIAPVSNTPADVSFEALLMAAPAPAKPAAQTSPGTVSVSDTELGNATLIAPSNSLDPVMTAGLMPLNLQTDVSIPKEEYDALIPVELFAINAPVAIPIAPTPQPTFQLPSLKASSRNGVASMPVMAKLVTDGIKIDTGPHEVLHPIPDFPPLELPSPPTSLLSIAPVSFDPVNDAGFSIQTHIMQPFVERQLDLVRNTAWLNDLARDIALTGKATDHISFALLPEKLGRLDVDLATSQGALSVKLTASSDDAARIIAAAQPRLVEELRGQGVRIASTDVLCDGAQSHHQPQPQSQQKHPPYADNHRTEYSHPDGHQKRPKSPARPNGRFA